MLLSSLTTGTSLLKQRVYYHGEVILYHFPEGREAVVVTPSLPVTCSRVEEMGALLGYENLKQVTKEWKKFDYFLKQGCSLYLGSLEGKITGYGIMVNLSRFTPYLYTRHPAFGDGNSFIFYCRTFPEYRNRGIYSFILTCMCRDARDRGEGIFLTTDPGNAASRRGVERAGFRQLGTLWHTEILGWRIESYFMHDDIDTEGAR